MREGGHSGDGQTIVVYPSRARLALFAPLYLLVTGAVYLAVTICDNGALRHGPGIVGLLSAACWGLAGTVFLLTLVSLVVIFVFTLYRLVVRKPAIVVNADGIRDGCSLIAGGMGLVRWHEIAGIYSFIYKRRPRYGYLVIVPTDADVILARRGPLARLFRRLIAIILPEQIGMPDWMLSVSAADLDRQIGDHYRAVLTRNGIAFSGNDEPEDERVAAYAGRKSLSASAGLLGRGGSYGPASPVNAL